MRSLRHRWSVRAAALALGLLATTPALAAASCSGNNLLNKLRSSEPASYDEVLAAANAEKNAQAILWKIEAKGLAPSWLFGTIHLSDDRVTKLSPAIKSALAGIKTLALEVEDLSPETMMAAVGARLRTRGGRGPDAGRR